MAVRATSPTRSPENGPGLRATSPTRTPDRERNRRSRSASDRTIAVERRRREAYRSSSESGSLQRLRRAKAQDASPTPARGESSGRSRRAKARSADSPPDGREGKKRHDVASRSRSSGRRSRKEMKDAKDEKPSRHGSLSSDLPETIQCKQCGSQCRGQNGLKMHLAYSKKCLAYGYWNKGYKPWDKCLSLANKEWQIRERRERQSRSQLSDRGPRKDRPCDPSSRERRTGIGDPSGQEAGRRKRRKRRL